MPQPDSSVGLGPAVFVGLSLYMLATGSPLPPPENPADRMNMAEIGQQAEPGYNHRPSAIAAFPASFPLPRPSPPGPPIPAYIPDMPGPAEVPGLRPAVSYAGTPEPPPTAVQPPGAMSLPWSSPLPTVSLAKPALPALAMPRPVWPLPRLFLPDPPPVPFSHPARTFVTITGDFVRLRAAPDTDAPILGRFDRGEPALLIEPRGKWTRVFLPYATPPRSGWIFGLYLRPISARPGPPAQNSDN